MSRRAIRLIHYVPGMRATRVLAALAVAASVPGLACGGDPEPLSPAEQDAYRQIVAYIEDPEAVATRGRAYQEAAAERLKMNVQTLRGADLGDDGDAALRTLGADCALLAGDGSESRSGAKCPEALDTLKEAVGDGAE